MGIGWLGHSISPLAPAPIHPVGCGLRLVATVWVGGVGRL